MIFILCFLFFFFKQKTAYEMRISDWSSDVCSSDLLIFFPAEERFLDQDFVCGRGDQAAANDMFEFLTVIGDTAAGAAQREGRTDDRRQAGALDRKSVV